MPRSREAEEEQAAQAKIDGTVQYWMTVSDRSGASLPEMARRGVDAMAALAFEHVGKRIYDPQLIEPILREPEFHDEPD